ncbi:MAG: hypothetical protein RI897_1004 [Verrucomicrobiota bacterium]
MVFLGDFDGDGAAFFTGEAAAAGEAGIRAFEAFDCEDGALFDDGELADFESADFFGDVVAELDIFLLFRGEFGAEVEAVVGHERLEPGGGLDEFDAFLPEFVGDGAEDGVGVFGFEFEEEAEGAEVGADVEEVFGGDLSGHDTVVDVLFLEGLDHFGELADADPGDVVDELGEFGVGFPFEGDGGDMLDA